MMIVMQWRKRLTFFGFSSSTILSIVIFIN
jgi:hypothetical protein